MTQLMMTMWLVANAGWPLSTQARPEVQRAHERYLAADWAGFSREVHAGLEATVNDEAATENLLELLDAAFEARAGKPLPVDFELPNEFRRLKVSIRRRQNAHTGKLMYMAVLSGAVKSGAMENLRLERFPNELVLDRRAGLGAWDVSPDADQPGDDQIWAGSECAPNPPKPGLYVVTFKMAGAPEVKGWFAFHHHDSSASPYVATPMGGEKLGARPTFRWSDFKSPQYRAFESRSLNLLVFDPNLNWTIAWSDWRDDLSSSQATVDKELKPGAYEMVLQFHERRHFGRLAVARDSATAVPFTVVP